MSYCRSLDLSSGGSGGKLRGPASPQCRRAGVPVGVRETGAAGRAEHPACLPCESRAAAAKLRGGTHQAAHPVPAAQVRKTTCIKQ